MTNELKVLQIGKHYRVHLADGKKRITVPRLENYFDANKRFTGSFINGMLVVDYLALDTEEVARDLSDLENELWLPDIDRIQISERSLEDLSKSEIFKKFLYERTCGGILVPGALDQEYVPRKIEYILNSLHCLAEEIYPNTTPILLCRPQRDNLEKAIREIPEKERRFFANALVTI